MHVVTSSVLHILSVGLQLFVCELIAYTCMHACIQVLAIMYVYLMVIIDMKL